MAGVSKPGINMKVSRGSDKVCGIGNWSIDGISRQELDDTEFGDTSSKWIFGLQDGGTVAFSGNYKPDDTAGQTAMIEAYDDNENITDLRFYVDATSYFEPCQTTGYLHPGKTTGANTQLSYVNLTSRPITADKGALAQISFGGRVSGQMVLV